MVGLCTYADTPIVFLSRYTIYSGVSVLAGRVDAAVKAFDFDQQLAMSQTTEVETAIRRVLFEKIPNLLGVHKAHKKNDLRGVDYWLELPGRMQTVDVKVRENDFSMKGNSDNVCLELVANIKKDKPGWTLDPDKITDWVLVYFKDTGRSYLYPFQMLQAVTLRERARWKADLKMTAQQVTKTLSGSYISESMFVSNRDIWASMYRLAQNRPLEIAPDSSEGEAQT